MTLNSCPLGENEPTQAQLVELSQAYEATLEIFTTHRSPQFFLCPVGLIGAGKTTVMKPLSKRLGVLRLCNDEVRKLLKEHGFDYRATHSIVRGLCEKYLDQGYRVALDADCAGSAKAYIRGLQERYPAVRIIWLHINPPEAFILHKLRTYHHTWLFKDGEDAVAHYEQRKLLHTHLDMPFFYTFDTSRGDLAEQIEEAAQKIEALK